MSEDWTGNDGDGKPLHRIQRWPQGDRDIPCGFSRRHRCHQRGHPVGTDLALSCEDDAGNLICCEPQKMLDAALEDVVPGAARDQKIEMTAVGASVGVGVVCEHVDLLTRGQLRVHFRLRLRGNPQHRIPRRNVMPGRQHLGQTDL